MRPIRNARKIPFPLLLLGLFGYTSIGYSADKIPVEITHGGRTESYELVRLYPNRVVVNNRSDQPIEIFRKDITSATNTNVRQLIGDALQLLSKFPKSNLKQFPELANSLEQVLVRIDEASLLYGWLLPDASTTARLVRNTDRPVKEAQTTFLSVQSEYESILSQVQAGATIDVNWEDYYKRLEQRASAITFPIVKKEFLAKVRKDNLKLKDLVRKITDDRITSLQGLMREVDQQLAAGTLIKDQWQESLQKMEQLVSGIPESAPKTLWSQQLQTYQAKITKGLAQLEQKQALSRLGSDIQQVEVRMNSASPDIDSLEKILGDLRLQVSRFPESPTQAALSSHLAELRDRVASRSVEMASAALAAEEQRALHSSGWLSSLKNQAARFLPSSPPQGGVIWWVAGIGGGLVLIFVLARLFRRSAKLVPPQRKPQVVIQSPPVPIPLEQRPAPLEIPTPEPSILETVPQEEIPEVDTSFPRTGEEEASQDTTIVDEPDSLSTHDHIAAPPGPEPLPAFPETLEEAQSPFELPSQITEETVPAVHVEVPFDPALLEEPTQEHPSDVLLSPPPFQVSFVFPEWLTPSPETTLSRMVRSPECQSQLKEGLPCGSGIPVSLHKTDRWLFMVKSCNEFEVEISAFDRYADLAEIRPIVRINPQIGTFCFHRDQIWILERDTLSVFVHSEDQWIERIHLEIPSHEGDQPAPAGPAFQPGLWLSGDALVFSRTPNLTEGFWFRFHEGFLEFSAWEFPMGIDLYHLDSDGRGFSGVSRDGDALVVNLAEKSWSLNGNLPGVAESLAESLPVGMRDQVFYCPHRGDKGFWRVHAWDLDRQSVLAQSPGIPGKPFSLHGFEDGVMVLNEKGVFYLDTPQLSLRWDFYALKGQAVRAAEDAVHVAMLVRLEEGQDSILVLGRNSGVDLWEITPEEHGLKTIGDLLIFDDQILLLGVLPDGTGCLKLM